MAVIAIPFVFLATVASTTSATPPSAPSAVPLEAFQRVVLPTTTQSWPSGFPRQRVPEELLQEQAASSTPAPTSKPPAGPVHVVRGGDTLWQIAIWHRAELEAIVRWNPTIDPQRLVIGQRILVPGGKPMLARAAARTGGAVSSTGSASHLWPLPVRGTITTWFSAAHRGIDIAAPAGTAVRAVAAGKVTWAGWKNDGGGFVVVIRHPDGMISTYNHNRRVLVRLGEVVARGQKIAEVGSTGWSTGPHLDLRIQMGGVFINPLRLAWLR